MSGTSVRLNDIANDVIKDAGQFQRWWQQRRHSHKRDKAIVVAAEKAGLLRRGGGLLVLSEAGRQLIETARTKAKSHA